ncbi:YqzH family protein [Bacillus manliponensis]|uniref:YqzH family protein n=1 Tax=Bacillus manliponensis TaxID=574376 RepID=UPI003514ED2D
MNEKLIQKMLKKSFRQYQCTPSSEEDYHTLITRIQETIRTTSNIDVHEAIEDIVYEYVTQT